MKKHLKLVHNNDMHGAFLPEIVDGKRIGGIAHLSGLIKSIREENPNTIYVNAGDLFRGSVIDSEFKGISTIEMVNLLNPDVVTIGNHEVDYGLAHLLFLEKCARFPIVNANMYIKTNSARLFEPYKIINIDGLNIMFIGIVTEEILNSTRNEDVVGSFVDVWEAAKQVGIIIDNYKTVKVDLTVLLTHIGLENDKLLASAIDPNLGVDLIIGGHSHTLLQEPVVVNNIPIAQVGWGTSHLGCFDIEIDDEDHKMLSYNWKLLQVDETVQKDDVILGVLDTYKKQTDMKYQRLITTFKKALTHPSRYQETELGNLFADLLQEDSSFDIMLLASGSIRLEKLGPVVTYEKLKECMPFSDSIYMLEVTGEQLRRMMLFMLRDEALKDDAHTEFYQVSKTFKMTYDYKNKQFTQFLLYGKQIRDDDIIKIALQDYHLSNFSEFFNVDFQEVVKNRKPRMVITEAFSIYEELLVNLNQVDSKIEGRIEIINRN